MVSLALVGDQCADADQQPGDAECDLASIPPGDASDDEQQTEHQQQRSANQESPHCLCLSLPNVRCVPTAIIAPNVHCRGVRVRAMLGA